MKAMIFAAGKGERMLPLTRDLPKPLLQVNKKMLIEYHLEKFARMGITEVIVNVAWMAEKIMQTLGDGERYGLHIRYSIEEEPLETAGAIMHARELLGDDPVLLANADVFTDFDFANLLNTPVDEHIWAQLVLVPNPEHHSGGDYSVTAEGVLQKPDGHGTFTFAGVSVLHPPMIYTFPDARRKFPLREVFAWALTQKKMRAQVYSGLWSDVGTPARLQALQATSA